VEYHIHYPPILLTFLIALAYSVISPAMLIFAMLYFGIATQVWKHQLLYVYDSRTELGGALWPQIFNRCIVALIIFQVKQISFPFRHQFFCVMPFFDHPSNSNCCSVSFSPAIEKGPMRRGEGCRFGRIFSNLRHVAMKGSPIANVMV
jgi:hypothetical protein